MATALIGAIDTYQASMLKPTTASRKPPKNSSAGAFSLATRESMHSGERR